MPLIRSILCALLSLVSTASAIEYEHTQPTQKLKYGLEALTTWRSDYIYRGLQLSSSTLEFQLAAEVSLNNRDSFNLGLYYNTATGKGSFSETAAYLELARKINDDTLTFGILARHTANSSFKSGAEFNLSYLHPLNDNFELTGTLSYDTAAEGAFAEALGSYYKNFDDTSYLMVDLGLTATANYYDISGVNHLKAKISYTYNISDAVSVSPYLAAHLALNNQVDDHIHGGIYFAVSF